EVPDGRLRLAAVLGSRTRSFSSGGMIEPAARTVSAPPGTRRNRQHPRSGSSLERVRDQALGTREGGLCPFLHRAQRGFDAVGVLSHPGQALTGRLQGLERATRLLDRLLHG